MHRCSSSFCDKAASADATLSAYLGGSPTVDITFISQPVTATNGENLSDAQAGARATAGTNQSAATSTGTYITLTVGSLSVTATIYSSSTASNAGNAGNAWVDELQAVWNAKYGGTAASSGTMSLVGTATDGGAANVIRLGQNLDLEEELMKWLYLFL